MAQFFRITAFLCVLILGENLYGNNFVAQVVAVRGKVTQMRPGALDPIAIKMGDEIIEDTSIATGSNSFVRIKFKKDSSVVNVGPNGQMVIMEFKEKGPGLINLLKGQLRAKVTKSFVKSKKGKEKLLIKTRTAALGVRGTDFHAMYNPDNKNTGLLAYNGEVAMVKLRPEHQKPYYRQVNREVRVTDVTEDGVEIEETETEGEILTGMKKYQSILKDKKTVQVKGGQFSTVVKKFEKGTEPVNISPVQLNLMYRNVDLFEKDKKVSPLGKKFLNPGANKLALKGVKQTAPTEGVFDKEEGKFAAKAGGFVDLKTGLYIPPHRNSEFDPKTQVYIPKKVGYVDNQTGQYIPPKGLFLDPKKGFVRDPKYKDHKKSRKLLAMARKLNKSMAQDIVLGDKKTKIKSRGKFIRPSKKETFTRDNVSVSYQHFSESMELAGDSVNGDQTFNATSGDMFLINWDLASGTRWRPFFSMALKRSDYQAAKTGYVQESEKHLNFYVGINHYINWRWSLVYKIGVDQEPFVEYSTKSYNYIRRISLTKIHLQAKGTLYRKNRFFINTLAGAFISPEKETSDLKVNLGFGGEGKLEFLFWLSSRWNASANAHFSLQKHNVENGTTSKADVTRTRTGGGINIVHLF